jgi:hypothetical protein
MPLSIPIDPEQIALHVIEIQTERIRSLEAETEALKKIVANQTAEIEGLMDALKYHDD